MKSIVLLSELQGLDTRSDENAVTRHVMEQRLANDSAVTTARADAEAAERQLNDLKTALRDHELEVSGLEAKIMQIEHRLYGGRVSNPKELQGLVQDETQLKKHKFDLEDKVLDLMAKIENAEILAKEKQNSLEKSSAQWNKQAEQARAALHGLEASDGELARKRDALRAQLNADDLRIYDDLRRTKKGRAVAAVKGTSCTACGVAVPSGLASRAKMGEELVFCVNCGRILVAQ